MSDQTTDDGMTELVDANIPRVDLVGKAANGTQFLIQKAREEGRGPNLLEAELVRTLITKADAQEGTMTAPAETVDTVEKADGDLTAAAEVPDLIAETPAGSTGDSVPGSPAWEGVDGDTAMNILSTLSRAKAAIEFLAGREATEQATGGGNGEDVWPLEDSASAIDCVIDQLASFAVGEQLEAEMSDELEEITKAAASLEAPVAVVEANASIVKAGRAISSASEAKLQTASQNIIDVLATIKQTPETPDAAPVAKSKETTVSDKNVAAPTIAAAPEATPVVAPTEPVAKAKGDPMTPVYNEDGKLVGMVDQTNLIPIAPTGGSSSDDAPADPSDPASLDPAPADAVGAPAAAPAAAAVPVAAPGTPVAKSVEDEEDAEVTKSQDEILKSIAEPILKELLDKGLDDVIASHPVVKALDDRLTAWENKPATPGVMVNGARPLPEHVRQGQPGAPDTAVFDRASILKEQAHSAGTAAEREKAQNELNQLASAGLTAIHQQRATRS